MKFSILKSFIGTALSVCIFAGSIPVSDADADEPETKLIALTFDDGPNTTTTNEILDILEEYNAKASFFLIGNNINDESAKSVKRAYDMGCEINNHSRSHPNMGSMSGEEIKAEVSYVDEKVYEITGEYPKFFRPPFIDTSQTMYENIDVPFICGVGCFDYMDSVTAQERADSILNDAKDGVIILLHDAAGNVQTVEALKMVMPELKDQGYEFVTLTELFERQGETPKEDMMYTYVAKYPCKNYIKYKNIFTGKAEGEPSWGGWSETAVLDGKLLEELGNSYAIEVEYSCEYEPVIALQKWSDGQSIWQPVKPSYFNGEKACFLAEDIKKETDSLDISFTDLDRMAITPYGGNMTITCVDILIKDETAPQEIKGDVNSDGAFDADDIITLQKYLLGISGIKNSKVGDLSGNGVIDITDLCIMKNEILKV